MNKEEMHFGGGGLLIRAVWWLKGVGCWIVCWRIVVPSCSRSCRPCVVVVWRLLQKQALIFRIVCRQVSVTLATQIAHLLPLSTIALARLAKAPT